MINTFENIKMYLKNKPLTVFRIVVVILLVDTGLGEVVIFIMETSLVVGFVCTVGSGDVEFT